MKIKIEIPDHIAFAIEMLSSLYEVEKEVVVVYYLEKGIEATTKKIGEKLCLIK